MPRYFFTLVYSDKREVRDPKGTVLLSDSAAIGAARTIIDDLLEEIRPGEPRPTIIVKNVAGDVIYRFPGN